MNLPNYILFSAIIGLLAYIYAVNSRNKEKQKTTSRPSIEPFILTYKERGMSIINIKDKLKKHRKG
jgi:hypothetical protein